VYLPNNVIISGTITGGGAINFGFDNKDLDNDDLTIIPYINDNKPFDENIM